jgi:hypothetical protein
MSSQGEQERLFREPPSDLFAMPTNRVTALMNDGEGTAAAVAELVEGDYQRSRSSSSAG